ncbi:RDD family protein [Paractinoplanes lichenicola]|uniref:RDD family protein n=1 Tax=Paractinoplanes lichenicola TaxID=2802976 RepID=A0ABS1W0J5_9ACTN|nr:RDD family protein [Actinoplanes lichenicola]MBL7260261.1 RDD family protein [Actinoplanes lichenicola]
MGYSQQTALNVHVTRRRIFATLIDGVVLSVVLNILGLVFDVKVPSGTLDLTTLSFGGSLLTAVVVLAYYIVLEGWFGRTAGKVVTGIRVVDENGNRPGFVSALVRTLLRLVDGIAVYLVAFVVVVNSSRRRRLGDMAAKTLVVRA